MNDIQKKELLVKDIEELESIKNVMLGENKNIIDGNKKLHELTEKNQARHDEIEGKLKRLEAILANKEKDNERLDSLIADKRNQLAVENINLGGLKKKIVAVNNDITEVEKNLEKAKTALDEKEVDKFIIGRMKEIILQMFQEMRPVYEKAHVQFPYPPVDELLSDFINKKDE